MLKGASLATIGTTIGLSWFKYGDKIPLVNYLYENNSLVGHIIVFGILAPFQYWAFPVFLSLLLSRDLTTYKSTESKSNILPNGHITNIKPTTSIHTS